MLDVVRRELVDVFVPVSSPAASVHDARVGDILRGFCDVLHVDSDTVRLLDDKAEFSRTAASLGLRVPRFRRITGRTLPGAGPIITADPTAPRPMVLRRLLSARKERRGTHCGR